jgi:cyclopropane fatty-acyl-phospholipid synthase-like methyltransferase
VTVDLAQSKKLYEFKSDSVVDALNAVGANAKQEVESQLEFVKNRGLLPEHKFLDLGCGCLRGSAKILQYLNDENFYGADISEGLLDMIPKRLAMLNITRSPITKLINDYDFLNLFNTKFHFILSVSVLTHMMPEMVPPFFLGVAKVLRGDGVFYFTLYPTDKNLHYGNLELSFFNKDWIIEEGRKAGLKIEDIPGDFPNKFKNYITRVNTPELGQWVMKGTQL